MQNPVIRRFVTIIAVLSALGVTLSACSGSSEPATRTVTQTVTALPSKAPQPQVTALKLETASQNPFGVVSHGVSAFTYPHNTVGQHRSYTCESGLNSLPLTIGQQKSYQGVSIRLTQQGVSSTNKQGSKYYFQYGVTLLMAGDLASFKQKSVSVILKLRLDGKAHPDDKVFNLGTGTFGNANALQFDPTDFTAISITGVDFCMMR